MHIHQSKQKLFPIFHQKMQPPSQKPTIKHHQEIRNQIAEIEKIIEKSTLDKTILSQEQRRINAESENEPRAR